MGKKYDSHDPANMIVGYVKYVWGTAGQNVILLSDCASSPGEGCGHMLDPRDIYVVRLDPGTLTPSVGDMVGVLATDRISETVYGGGWWEPTTEY